MRHLIGFMAAMLLAATGSYSALTFVNPPSINYNTSNLHWDITFQVSESTDVEVAVVRLSDSSIVRHLAAGRLGPVAPLPLISNSLAQALTWDGKDDLGVPVADTSAISVRVRAGMSVSLVGMTAPDPYHIGVQVYGVATDENGNAYVQSTTGTMWTTTLRKYDADGNYLATVYPFPGNLATDQVRGYGVNEWSAGSWYSPRATGSAALNYSSTLVGSGTAWLMDRLVNGQLGLFNMGGWPTNYFMLQTILPTGAMVEQKSMIASPALPRAREMAGDPFLCPAPGKDYIYLSGIYQTVGNDEAVNPGMPLTDVFYHEGQIFKVNLGTGAVTSLLTVENVPYDTATRHAVFGDQYGLVSAVRGLATDDSGHIFVCDRANQRVTVYDTVGALLGAIPIRHPELVAVDKYNGAIYVITNWFGNEGYPVSHVSLHKFSTWRPGYAHLDSLMEFTSGIRESFGGYKRSKVFMSLVQSSVKPVIWVAGGNNVWTVADEGGDLSVQFDFASRQQQWVVGYDRVAVDRRSETVYINDGWAGLYKIEDWSAPVATPCSTAANQRLYGTDVAISPSNMLYVREGNGYSGPLTRYTLDHLHAPVPFANSGTNVQSSYIYSRMGAGFGEKGLAVAPNGDVAISYMSDWAMYVVGRFGDSTGHSGDTACDTSKAWNNRILSCVGGYPYPFSPRFDLQGNLYVGIGGILPQGYAFPSGFSADATYRSHMGAVVRFPAGTMHCNQLAARNEFSCADAKIYPMTLPAVWTGCVCRSPRFDVDAYGRLFVPDFFHNQVTVSDNEGNTLTQFGHYGNIDSWGPGSPVPEVDIPLASPLSVAASDNYIYINDMVSNRLARVRMDYVLDNIPGIKKLADEKAAPVRKLALTHFPSPFNPMSRISILLPERAAVRLDVYDVKGRFIRNLAAREMGKGAHQLVWDAKDASGGSVSAGVYVYRLTAGTKILTTRTLLVK